MVKPLSALRAIIGAFSARSRPAGAARAGLRTRGIIGAGALLLLGGAAGAGAMQAGGGDVANRAAIETIVRDYILANPEIIPQAMQALKAKQAAASVAQNRAAFETPYRGAWEGAETPKVTVVEFFDYACSFCKASLPDIERLIKDNPDVRVVYRELPILSEESTRAARVSLLAAEQGRYRAFHAALYAAGPINDDSVLKAAQAAGLGRAAARAALTSESRDAEIGNNIRLAQSVQADGTPLFIIGDKVLFGAVGYEALRDAVAAARK